MSSEQVRRVSTKDIQVVQNLIERCLQLYMNQREVVETLLVQAKIEPGFTELVWLKLEEENREFFKSYHLRLKVKQQIMEFNKLIEEQVRLMHQVNPAGVGSIPSCNGSHISSLQQNSACYAQEHTGLALKPEDMHHPAGSSLTTGYTNGISSLHSGMHGAVEMAAHANRMDVPVSMLSVQSSNMGLMQGINGVMVKSEAGYSGASPYVFGAEGNMLEARPSIVDASVGSFSSVESSSQPLNESILDADTSPFGYLSQIPQTFSLSDLTADFTQNSVAEIMEAYPRSPYLATDSEDFPDSYEREHQGDNKRLDTISEGMSYGDFGSE